MKVFLAFLAVPVAVALVSAVPGLQEAFEGDVFPPAGWTVQTAGLPRPHAWHRTANPRDRGSGRYSAFIDSDSPGPIDEWLISPELSLGDADSALTFSWSGSPYWSSSLDASVNIRAAGDTGWTTLWSLSGNESPADPFIYRKRLVDISRWIGKRVQIAFRVAGSHGASFGLDDVAVGDLAPKRGYSVEAESLCAEASHARSSCPWRVSALREPWASDVALETKNRYLQAPPGNVVPGPDSLVARVVIVERRGHIEIEDLRTGSSRRLLDTGAFLPQWSPDGKLIACAVWTREAYAGKLTVVEVASGKIVAQNDLAHAGDYKWSPDSHAIAVSGIAYRNWRGAFLYTMTIPDGHVSVIDSLDLLGGHEFSWSPDGRWIAFSRPTELSHYGDTIAAGLWIADVATSESWCLLDLPEWAETDPLWITNQSIQITRVRRGDGEETNREERLVVELSEEPPPPWR